MRKHKIILFFVALLCVCVLVGMMPANAVEQWEMRVGVASASPKAKGMPETVTTTQPIKSASPIKAESVYKYNSSRIRGVWVATVGNLDFPTKQNLSVTQLKKELTQIVNNCAKSGLNTIFFQVRPASDALYKSSVYPWSEYLTGKQGVAPEGGFDPLAYIIEEAKAKNIGVQAWINPYRASVDTHKFKNLSKDNPARKYKNLIVKCSDGKMYFNPGLKKSRDLVVAGVKEIVENYDVQGIHFDDYFYPDVKFNDKATYKKYGSGFKTKKQWRRNNVNLLIKEVRAAVKAVDSNVQFGVSPAGVWANKYNNKLGSDTRGNETFYAHCADTRKWVKKNWVDYIIPQIYWKIGDKYADYKTLVEWWSEVAAGTGTELYIGLASYRLDKKSSDKAWRSIKMLRREVKLNRKYKEISGSVFFRYEQIKENTFGIRKMIKNCLVKEK